MVVHDHEQEQKWMQKQRNTPREKTQNHTSPRRLSLVAVQCLACAIVLLIVLLFRVAGGTAYSKLQQGFSDALSRNELMAVLMRLWDADAVGDEEVLLLDGVNGEDFTPDTG